MQNSKIILFSHSLKLKNWCRKVLKGHVVFVDENRCDEADCIFVDYSSYDEINWNKFSDMAEKNHEIPMGCFAEGVVCDFIFDILSLHHSIPVIQPYTEYGSLMLKHMVNEKKYICYTESDEIRGLMIAVPEFSRSYQLEIKNPVVSLNKDFVLKSPEVKGKIIDCLNQP